VNLHYSMPNPKPTPTKPLIKGMGWPFKTIEGFIDRASWVTTMPAKFKDVWFCTSLQSMASANTKGKPKAVRLAANALKVKALWIDADVGVPEPGKKPKYPDIQTALKAILLFAKTVGLPDPSAVVYSGGGVHVYWISKDPLDPAQWAPYAAGLKSLLLGNNVLCDAGLTTDIARILRVPGTFNHKYDPPKPVTLAPMPLKLYDFEPQLGFLKTFAGPIAVQGNQKPQPEIFAEGADLESFKRPPVFKPAQPEPDLNAGIDKFDETLLKAAPIFKECGFYKEALLKGGANCGNELWMYSVLGATFMENGNAIAHAISKGHATYSEADTQALYDRKVAERHDRGIGYPSCSAIKGAGCTACAACPLFTKGKSPLSIRDKITAAVNPTTQSAAAVQVGLPASFDLNGDGVICKVLEDEEDGDITTMMIPLFQCTMSDFWLQKHPGEHINFTMTVDKGCTEQATVDLGEVAAHGFPGYLCKRRVLITTVGERYLKEFFLSMIGKLRSLAAAQTSTPFGWYSLNGARRGFVFGGTILMDDGTERPCGAIDPNISRMYQPKGDLAEWMKAANSTLDRRRPELTSIILTAFAAPLISFTDHNSLMISACGTDSGAGKSSAAKIGMSVWGDPILTKGTESQTVNNITTVMKTIRNLPFYWDEITAEAEREKISKVMMEADGGKEKGRNKDGTTTQAAGTWQLMLSYTANHSLKEHLRKRNRDTSAQLMRCLEWEVKRVQGGTGHMQTADADVLVGLTRNNYGLMGMVYAKYLALNHARIAHEVLAKCKAIQTLLKPGDDERLWTTGLALMTLAAKYAKDCGLNIDHAEIEKFMYQVYQKNLSDRDQFASGGHVDNSETVLTRYLREREAQQRVVWTNYMHNKQGKPSKPVLILKGPMEARNNIGAVEVRFAQQNEICVIAKTDFDAYLAEYKHSETQIYAALTTVYAYEKQKLQICSGYVQDPGREDCIVLHLKKGTPLWYYLMTGMPPEEKAKLEEGLEVEPLETGLDPNVHEGATLAPIQIDPVTGRPNGASVREFVQGAARGP
jgi:hypothetical protein